MILALTAAGLLLVAMPGLVAASAANRVPPREWTRLALAALHVLAALGNARPDVRPPILAPLIDPNFLPLFAAMPLQDAIDYAVHLIRATIDTLRFEPRYPSVGGPIDVLVIRSDGMQWVQRKELHESV